MCLLRLCPREPNLEVKTPFDLGISVVELPGIEPVSLPGNMPSELQIRSVSVRFSPTRYLRFRSRVLTPSRVRV